MVSHSWCCAPAAGSARTRPARGGSSRSGSPGYWLSRHAWQPGDLRVIDHEPLVVDSAEIEFLAGELLADGQEPGVEPLLAVARVAQKEREHGAVLAHDGTQQRDIRMGFAR